MVTDEVLELGFLGRGKSVARFEWRRGEVAERRRRRSRLEEKTRNKSETSGVVGYKKARLTLKKQAQGEEDE